MRAQVHKTSVWTPLSAVLVAGLSVWLSLAFSQAQTTLNYFPHLVGQTGSPDISRDGKNLAFEWWPLDPAESGIYIVPIGGGVPVSFAKSDGRGATQSPKWSPDGKWIAFMRSDTAREALLFIKSRMTGDERLLGVVCIDQEAWAPDSTAVIAAASKSSSSGIQCNLKSYSIRVGEVAQPLGVSGSRPALSHAGDRLAFLHDQEIRVVALTPGGKASGAEVTVAGEPRGVASLTWTPDDKQILYVAMQDRSLIRRVSPLAGSIPSDLSRVDGQLISVAAAPDGNLFGGVERRENSCWVIDLKAPNSSAALSRMLPWNVGPAAVSPDGKSLLYSVSSTQGVSDVYSSTLGSAESRRLFRLKYQIEHLWWSPDARRFAFVGTSGSAQIEPSRLFTASVSGGLPQQLLTQFDNVDQAAWSKDGRILFVAAQSKGSESIFKLGLNDSTIVRVAPGSALQLEVSPDDRYLYLRQAPATLVRVSVDGGQTEFVAGGVLRFAVAENGIYIERQDSKPPSAEGLNLYRIDATSHVPVFIANLGFLPPSMSLERDGQLYMERQEPLEEHVGLIQRWR